MPLVVESLQECSLEAKAILGYITSSSQPDRTDEDPARRVVVLNNKVVGFSICIIPEVLLLDTVSGITKVEGEIY